MTDFLNAYPVLVWTIVYTLIAAFIVSLLWEKLRWWWLNTWYSVPVIGKLARLSKDLHKPSDGDGWYKSERTLCQAYKGFVPVQSEYDFNQRMTYLHKAGDNGRRTTPMAIWVLIVTFVMVEALGFSYVLAGYTVPGASESTQKFAAFGIAFVVSALCVFLTHHSGHELYRSLKIRQARKEWIEDGGKNKLRSHSMPLKKPQHLDDSEPEYTQVGNRVGVNASFVVSWLTLAFVLAIAAGATYVRVQSANKLMEESVRVQKTELRQQQSGAGGLEMTDSAVVPEVDAASSIDADGNAVEEAAQYDLHGYWVTFIILAVLFVFLQLLGVLFGYRWGFAGENSKEAFHSIGRGKYLTYNDFRAASQRFIDQAQNQLENLQQRMIRRHAEEGTGLAVKPNKTFIAFLAAEEKAAAIHRKAQRDVHDDETREALDRYRRDVELGNQVASPEKPGQQSSFPSTTNTAQKEEAGVNSGAALRQLDAFGSDADAKRRYLDSLPDAVFAEVKQALQDRKLQLEANRVKRNAEIEDLL